MARKLEIIESELPKITGKDYKCPIKFELEIQRQRILYILHWTLKKMRIMAHLPTMLKDDCKILRMFLKKPDVEFIKYACSKYMPGGQTDSMKIPPSVQEYCRVLDDINLKSYYDEGKEYLADALLGTLTGNQKVDYHISQVIQIITSNDNLTRYIKTTPLAELTEPVINLIECMKHLTHLIHERLMITSQEQMDNDKRLRVAYKSNFIISDNIKRLEEQMEKQRNELGSELEKNNAILKGYRDKLEFLKDAFQTEVTKKVQKSEKTMMTDSFNSEAKQVELEREAIDSTNKYSALLEDNLNQEGQLRAKRNKLEAQLASWIGKYDNDIGEKQTELENLQEKYNDMKREYEELQRTIEEQSYEYDILMAEKAEEEQRIFEERAIEFLRNRSARIIQRAWRAYWQRKLERRKSKKGKGKDKKKKKAKIPKKEESKKLNRAADANVVLQKSFKKQEHVFEDLDTSKDFSNINT